MTKDKAYHKYLEDFMKIAFPDAPVKENDYFHCYATQAPDDAILPYMVYQYKDATFEDGPYYANIKIWSNSGSEAKLNQVVTMLRKYIDENDLIRCDEGGIIVYGIENVNPVPTEWEGIPRVRSIELKLENITRY